MSFLGSPGNFEVYENPVLGKSAKKFIAETNMLYIGKPNSQTINEVLLQQKTRNLSYDLQRGTLKYLTPEEYKKDDQFKQFNIDYHRIKLGMGENAFKKAIEGLRGWKQFNFDWVELYYPNTPLIPGADVIVVARSLGVWTASACRVVYVIEEGQMDTTNLKRFGFAYGTLEQHVENGEERFIVEWNTQTDEVYYEILGFSIQNTWFTKLGAPVARYFQQCFATDSGKAMQDWVNGVTTSDQLQNTYTAMIV